VWSVLAFLLVCLSLLGFAWGLAMNSLVLAVAVPALMAVELVLRTSRASVAALPALEQTAVGRLAFVVPALVMGFFAGPLAYASEEMRQERGGLWFLLGMIAMLVLWMMADMVARFAARRSANGLRWQRAVVAAVVLVAGVTAAVASSWAGLGWTEVPDNGAAISVGNAWTMRKIICPDVHPVGACGIPEAMRRFPGLWSAIDEEAIQALEHGDGAVMVVELARGDEREYEPLRGRRVWVDRRLEPGAWRLCSGGPATGPCIDTHPGTQDWHDLDRALRARRSVVQDVQGVAWTWISCPLLGIAAGLSLLRAGRRERRRWRDVREGEHTGDGWVRWADGTSHQVPGARDLPLGPVVVREGRRTADLLYRGGPVLVAEVWPGPLPPRLAVATARADAWNAIALLVIVLLGAPFVAAAWTAW
jgi:hypothetical protein